MTGFDEDAWTQELESHRQRKDEAFAEDRNSPIPPADREGFDGLAYYEPDPAYRVEATVEVHDEPDPVEFEVSSGPPERYLRVATLHFPLDGEDYSLVAYRQEGDDEGTYFVPFRDKTTGQTTYGGGRYLELYADADLVDGDEITVDFNLAYSPFCAYNDAFACPLPPEENWLDVLIEAGERAP